MELLPAIEIPKFVCRFDNYVQSIEIIQNLVYIFVIWGLAIWGLLHFIFWILQLIRPFGEKE